METKVPRSVSGNLPVFASFSRSPGKGSAELVCAHTVRSPSGWVVSYTTTTFPDSTRRNNLERWPEHYRSPTKAETVRSFRSCSTTAATSSSRVGSREVAHRKSGPPPSWRPWNEQCLLSLGRTAIRTLHHHPGQTQTRSLGGGDAARPRRRMCSDTALALEGLQALHLRPGNLF